MKEELINLVSLARCFMYDSAVANQLLRHYNSIENIFATKAEDLIEALGGKYAKVIHRLFSKTTRNAAQDDIEIAFKMGYEIISINDTSYPSRLRECPDAPILLFKKGECSLEGSRHIAIIGTRNSTEYGERICEKIINYLSNCSPKPVIISGMALGIDTCAHKSALKYGLKTIAIMGTGFGTIYPPSNLNLSNKISKSGCLITEYGNNIPSFPLNFARRNRIIAGLSDAVILCESKEKGGGIITSKLAFEYNRVVFAVPGRITDDNFKGCNSLIGQQVANIITDASTITNHLNWDLFDKKAKANTSIGEIKKEIIQILKKKGELSCTEISEILHISVGDTAKELLELELSGYIIHLCSNKYSI